MACAATGGTRESPEVKGTASGLHLRRGRPGDAAALAAFAARAFTEAFGADNRPEDLAAHLAKHFSVARQTAELTEPGRITILAGDDTALAAYAQLRWGTPPACVTVAPAVELQRFYVDRPWQGRGLAQRLMAAALGAARELGGRALWLSVWERNPRAIAFYARSGSGTRDLPISSSAGTGRPTASWSRRSHEWSVAVHRMTAH